jgi:hypothetical protein
MVGAALIAALALAAVWVVSANGDSHGPGLDRRDFPDEPQHTPSIGDAFSVSSDGTISLTRLNYVQTVDSTRDRRVVIGKVTIKNQGDRMIETRLAPNSRLITSTGAVLASKPSATLRCNTARGWHMNVPSRARKSACVAFVLSAHQEPARLKMHLFHGADLMRWVVSGCCRRGLGGAAGAKP